MTPIPGYPPPGSLPEASEASRGNPSAHPSNDTPEEHPQSGIIPSNPLSEASEASCGNPSAHPSNATLYEDATSAENVLTPTHEASEASRGNPFNASLDTINEPYTVLFDDTLLIATGAIHEEVQPNENPPHRYVTGCAMRYTMR